MTTSPYLDFSREHWRNLRKSVPQLLTEDEVTELAGIGENIDLEEVADVYLPLARLLHLQIEAHRRVNDAAQQFLGHPPQKVPFIIAVAGSVAVGKSPLPVCCRSCCKNGINTSGLISCLPMVFYCPRQS